MQWGPSSALRSALQRLHPTDYPRLTAIAPHYLSHLSAESFTGAVEHLIAGFGITAFSTQP